MNTDPDSMPLPAVIEVPDIRDYQRINAELTQLLDQGARHIRLTGVESQRLLVSGLRGRWSALVEVEGNPGPELGAKLDAPGLRVVCLGSAADGVGSGMLDGRILVLGNAGTCVGICQRGGVIAVLGSSAERAGLNQQGGALVLLGEVGALAGERQVGGLLIARGGMLGAHPGRGRRGGRILPLGGSVDAADESLIEEALGPFRPWLPQAIFTTNTPLQPQSHP